MIAKFDLDKELEAARGDDLHGYLREAAANYRSDSHRSCIVSIYNAVFLNIYTKLEHLVEVNRKNREIFDRAKHLKDKKQPYEHNLTEEMFKAGMITSEQQKFLEELRQQRNDAAHPIGGDWPATKAAYFLTDGVRLFLSQQSLSPNAVMAEIVGRLKGDNCFPSGNRSSQRAIVAMEVGMLIPAAYHLFVKELYASWYGDDLVLRENVGIFVREALSLKNADLERAIVRVFVEPILKHLDPRDVKFIISIVLSSPSWVNNLSSVSKERIARLIREYSAGTQDHGVRIFLRIHKSAPLMFDGTLKATLRPLIAANVTDPRLLAALTRQGAAREELLLQYRLHALGRTRTGMLEFLQRYRTEITSRLSGFESYVLLLATSEAEQYGAFQTGEIAEALFEKARAWFEGGRETATMEARKAGVYDPAQWFGETYSCSERVPATVTAA